MLVAPSRGRGLKRDDEPIDRRLHEVAPSRGRGLKPLLPGNRHLYRSSPLHGGVD